MDFTQCSISLLNVIWLIVEDHTAMKIFGARPILQARLLHIIEGHFEALSKTGCLCNSMACKVSTWAVSGFERCKSVVSSRLHEVARRSVF